MNTTIRYATARDDAALERLAQLDSSVVPAAPLLLAEAGGQLIAAISARDGTVIADPFTRSAAAADLLRHRARRLDAGAGRPRRARTRRLRPLPR